MVGVERLHPRHGRADVRLRGGNVRTNSEAQVRRDGDREQDPEDDDDDEKLDQGEAGLVAGQAVAQSLHLGTPFRWERWLEPIGKAARLDATRTSDRNEL